MTAFRCTLGLLAVLVAAPVYAEKAAPKPIVVPFELLKSGHMAVMVKVNGKGPYRLIFDTGAPITLLNNKVAKEAGLLKNARRPAFSLFGSMGDVKVKSLEVGGQKAANVTAIIMDHPTVAAISKALGPIEGIVGFPFFARYRMTLDYRARTLTFVPSGFKPPDVLKAMEAVIYSALMQGDDPPAKVLAPAAQWGMVAEKKDGDEQSGVTIREVLPGSPAAAGGVRAGDRLLTLDGRWTDSLPDLYVAAGYVKPGRSVSVKVLRDGKEVELKVKPVSGL